MPQGRESIYQYQTKAGVDSLDTKVRMAAFDWLANMVDIHGDVLPRAILERGFDYQDQRVPLVGPQGIFKPKVISEIPLSITTSPNSPYDDSFGGDGLLLYKYRGINPNHHENVGLRNASHRKVPLVYFHGVVPGRYLAVWPVFIVSDSPETLSFKVAVDDPAYLKDTQSSLFDISAPSKDDESQARRAYITSSVRQRLHQRGFREKVLHAYRDQCAMCRLRHRELLDAAHIIPDREPEGVPAVKNGISLCKLHHAAFDKLFIGIRPDYIIEIRPDILNETDGPMLRYGLQQLHQQKLILPRANISKPDPDLLANRWERYKTAA